MTLALKSGRFVMDDGRMPDECVDVLFAGDLCPLGRTESLVLEGRQRDVVEDLLPVLSDKDLSVVNLETALTLADTAIPKSGPNLKVDPRCVELVRTAGFDVACCANNHIGDFGPEEAETTLAICHANDIETVGAGKNLTEARAALFVERKGIRIALLAFAENEFGIARADAAGSNPLDPLRNIQDIREAADKADITVVLVHGGNEYNPVPSPRMVRTYRAFAEAGAAAVIAGHPHCPQGIEMWHGRPIVYSLGNFLFDYSRREYRADDFWWSGYMVRISFAAGKACALEAIPYTFGPSAERVRLLRGEDKESFLGYLEHLSCIVSDEAEAGRYWDGWCAMKGPEWVRYLAGTAWPVDPNDSEAIRTLLSARNAFSCEAHCELITRFLRLACEGRVESASTYIPKIQTLQTGAIPE